MALPRRLSAPTALLALLLLGACDGDAANLAREITDARGDCTQEKLKASDTACVAMMQKYAEIGTSAIETYIGAVKSMDQALQRMPPANFDTAGFGHALTPASAAARAEDSLGAFGGYGDARTGPLDSRGRSSYGAAYDPRAVSSYGSDYAPRDPRSARPNGPRFADPRYADPRYADPQYADPRNSDPRDPASGYRTPRYPDPRYQDPRDPGPGYSGRRDPDGGEVDARGPARGDSDARYADPREVPAERGGYDIGAAPARRAPGSPGRGLLLPPEQRLDRPWLRAPEDAEPREVPDRARARARAERPDGYLPSHPLPADTLGPYDEDRPRTRRPEGD